MKTLTKLTLALFISLSVAYAQDGGKASTKGGRSTTASKGTSVKANPVSSTSQKSTATDKPKDKTTGTQPAAPATKAAAASSTTATPTVKAESPR